MSGKRILVVEDEVMVAMTLEDTLEALGYEVAGTVDNGRDAIRLAAEKKPDLILMDIRIRGDIDGIETADRISGSMDIPVVFLTAHSDEQTLMRALKTQPYGFLIKPFRERELYSNIEMAIHKHRVLKTRNRDGGTEKESPSPYGTAVEAGPAISRLHEKETVEVGTDTERLKNHVFESIQNPLFVLNGNMKIVLYNRKFAELCVFFNISESTFRASAEKAGIFPLFGSTNDFMTTFTEGRENFSTLEVMTGEIGHTLKITKIPVKEGHMVAYVMAVIEDITYEKMLEDSGELYHKTAEGIINLSHELKGILKGHEDPRLNEIADTSDDLVLEFARTDEEWLKIKEMRDLKKIWDL
ncbi:response regulator receiver protein [Methanolacinia petrolearia DSM 11571]|uniref:Response regulator receiver protein n=1 Tax=Methanolacinia petrolearia (strain DSM 11571 / OCM 486 / SEBR 4847) TaxID=679926 RepID=E1REL4_METP4|nr:response regulator [Methanolacinia petrolearia]ADN34961.1 response regulator receiver protein [Methanolacinia petrolearia DSM 11571]